MAAQVWVHPRRVRTPGEEEFRESSPAARWTIGSEPVVFDFGREIAGRFSVLAHPPDADCVVLGVSEHDGRMLVNAEAATPLKERAGEPRDGRLHLVTNDEGWEGFRYATVAAAPGRTVTISDPAALTEPAPEPVARLTTADPELDAIWQAGVHTIQNHLRGDHVSALLIDRGDRWAWCLDFYCAEQAVLDLFGDTEIVRRTLERLRGVDNGIYGYPLYWVLGCVDLYDFTGRREDLEPFLSDALEIVRRASRDFDRLPPLTFVGWDERVGAGFEEPDLPEARRVIQALILRTTVALSRAATDAGFNEVGDELTVEISRLAATVSSPDWIDQAGVYALSEAVLTECLDQPTFRRVAGNPLWATPEAIYASLPAQWTVVNALQRIGRTDRALAVVKTVWGGQLAVGGTNYFEAFRPFWQRDLTPGSAMPNGPWGFTSLSHAWGSVIASWLSRVSLGIAGRRSGHLELDPGGGLPGARGAVAVMGGSWSSARGAPGPPLVAAMDAPPSVVLPVLPVRWWDVPGAVGYCRLDTPTPSLASAPHEVLGVEVFVGPTRSFHGEGTRYGASARTGFGTWSEYSLAIDIRLGEGAPMIVGLFTVDDTGRRSQTVEFVDLETRSHLDSGRLVGGFRDGVIVALECRRSVRIRCSSHLGDGAIATGLVFIRPTPDGLADGLAADFVDPVDGGSRSAYRAHDEPIHRIDSFEAIEGSAHHRKVLQ